MDIGNILNSKAAAAAAATQQQHNQGLLPTTYQLLQHQLSPLNRRSPSDTGSARAGSPPGSEQSSRYSSRSGQPHTMSNLSNGMSYPSPSQMPVLQNGLLANGGYDNGMMSDTGRGPGRPPGETAQKAFPCSTCAKGFARRSDLARHGKSRIIMIHCNAN